jgi:putative acyl-CoA dehydrogenase
MRTHEVLNQPPPLVDVNLWSGDPTLAAAVRHFAADAARAAEPSLAEYGARLGSAEVQRWADQANQVTPILHTHDRFGHRVDEVEYHPGYHAMMALTVEHGVAGAPWREDAAGAHVVRAAKMILASQVEFGHLCPVSMTYSAVPALRRQPDLLAEWRRASPPASTTRARCPRRRSAACSSAWP